MRVIRWPDRLGELTMSKKCRLGKRERALRRLAFSVKRDIVCENLSHNKPKPACKIASTNAYATGTTASRFRDPVGNIFKGSIVLKNQPKRYKRWANK